MSDLSASFGIRLDDWQDLVLQAAMGERADGTWSSDVVGLSVPRQNGKSQLLVARALAGALLFGEQKIIISAHAQDTAREAFSKLLEMRDASPALDDRIDKVMTALNREYVKFKNGAVIQFKARTVSGSRGFSCDCLLLDEAQILGMPAWVSIRSTMSARPNPQAWLLGTPPTPEDNAAVFTAVRESAIGGKSRRTTWLEWAAEPADDPALVATRRKANPAWDTRINHEVVQGEYETYPPERFALDRLGIWPDERAASVFDLDAWRARRTDLTPPPPLVIALAVSIDQAWASIAAAGDVDGTPYIGAVDRRRATAWVVPEVARISKEHGVPVVVDGKGPAGYLIPALRELGVDVLVASTDDYVTACADLLDRVTTGGVWHGGHDDLDEAVPLAVKRSVGDRFAWARKSGDISMLEAATLALWGASQEPTYDVLDSIF